MIDGIITSNSVVQIGNLVKYQQMAHRMLWNNSVTKRFNSLNKQHLKILGDPASYEVLDFRNRKFWTILEERVDKTLKGTFKIKVYSPDSNFPAIIRVLDLTFILTLTYIYTVSIFFEFPLDYFFRCINIIGFIE